MAGTEASPPEGQGQRSALTGLVKEKKKKRRRRNGRVWESKMVFRGRGTGRLRDKTREVRCRGVQRMCWGVQVCGRTRGCGVMTAERDTCALV